MITTYEVSNPEPIRVWFFDCESVGLHICTLGINQRTLSIYLSMKEGNNGEEKVLFGVQHNNNIIDEN